MNKVYQAYDGSIHDSEAEAMEYSRGRAKHDLDYTITQMTTTHDAHRGTITDDNPVGELTTQWRSISDELLDVIIYNGEALIKRIESLKQFNQACRQAKGKYNNPEPTQAKLWDRRQNGRSNQHD